MIRLIYDKKNCVGCPPEMGCMGKACPQCWETEMKCDRCKEVVDDLYAVEDEQLCPDCFDTFIHEIYTHITADNSEDFINEDCD